ncbi:hypothetical protein EDC94DRAFT_618180, partial [Helicostylum pulchrum]
MALIESNNTTIALVNKCSNDAASSSVSLLDSNIKPIDLSHGQCTWCGKYGHSRRVCPFL